MSKKASSKTGATEGQGQLQRNLSLFEASMFGISFVIGTGVFLKPTSVLAATGSTGKSLLVWIIAGLISLCAALTIAEIAAYIPKLGGMFAYITELYGEAMGFVYGFVTVFVSGAAGPAASAIAFSTFASYFIDMSKNTMIFLSVGIVILFGIIQCLSTKGAMKLQVVGTFGKMVPIFAIVLVGVFKGSIPGAINMSLVGDGTNIAISGALIGALYAYDGWVATCSLGEEMIDANRNLPKAIILSLTFIIGVYVLFNYVIFKTVDPQTILASENVGIVASEKLFGRAGATLITVGLLVSSVVTMNAQMMNNERNILPMAQRRLLPASEKLSKINPKFNTPITAILLQIILTFIYILSGSFDFVTNIVVFVVWIFFTMAIFGIFILRKRYPRDEKLYKTPLYPVVPILGILGGGYLVISTLIGETLVSVIGLGTSLLALVVYFIFSKKNKVD